MQHWDLNNEQVEDLRRAIQSQIDEKVERIRLKEHTIKALEPVSHYKQVNSRILPLINADGIRATIVKYSMRHLYVRNMPTGIIWSTFIDEAADMAGFIEQIKQSGKDEETLAALRWQLDNMGILIRTEREIRQLLNNCQVLRQEIRANAVPVNTYAYWSDTARRLLPQVTDY